jgi:hypothetical protein
MPVQPIDPVSDARVEHKTAELNGQTYHYLYAVPKGGEFERTVFLVSLLPTSRLETGVTGRVWDGRAYAWRGWWMNYGCAKVLKGWRMDSGCSMVTNES